MKEQSPAAATPCKVGVILLAAGASTRMGRPKLLLPWGSMSILGHLVAQWREIGAAQVGIVCAANDTAMERELARCAISSESQIINPAPERGMFSSIQTAAAWGNWRQDLTHWAIVLGDQPHLRPDTLRQLLGQAALHPEKICQPMRAGHGRHPVLLPAAVFRQLPGATAANLKQFLVGLGHATWRYEADDAGLDLDLDSPADYDRARREFGSGV